MVIRAGPRDGGVGQTELELVQPHRAQKPVLRVEVGQTAKKLLQAYVHKDMLFYLF